MGMTSFWKSARTPFYSAPCSKGFITSARKAPCFLRYGVRKMNTRSCSDRWARFIVWDTRLTGTGSIRPEAGAFDSRFTRGSGSVVGLSPQPRTSVLIRGRPPGAGQGTILCWAGISKRRTRRETTLDKNSLPYLDDHRIQGVAVLPASAYVEMALVAAVEVFGAQSVALKDIEFRKALFLPSACGIRRRDA